MPIAPCPPDRCNGLQNALPVGRADAEIAPRASTLPASSSTRTAAPLWCCFSFVICTGHSVSGCEVHQRLLCSPSCVTAPKGVTAGMCSQPPAPGSSFLPQTPSLSSESFPSAQAAWSHFVSRCHSRQGQPGASGKGSKPQVEGRSRRRSSLSQS